MNRKVMNRKEEHWFLIGLGKTRPEWYRVEKTGDKIVMINRNGDRRNATDSEFVSDSIVTSDPWSITDRSSHEYDIFYYERNSNLKYGWMYPSGKVWRCHYHDHEAIAHLVFGRSHDQLYELGYRKLTVFHGETEPFLAGGMHETITSAQRDAILKEPGVKPADYEYPLIAEFEDSIPEPGPPINLLTIEFSTCVKCNRFRLAPEVACPGCHIQGSDNEISV